MEDGGERRREEEGQAGLMENRQAEKAAEQSSHEDLLLF